MTKTLVCSFPPLSQTYPPIAGAIIANICSKEGHSVVAVDFQAELNKFLTDSNLPLDYFDDIFYENPNLKFSPEQQQILEKFILNEASRLDIQQFDYIAGSLFSFLAQQFCRTFLELIRPITKSKIIIGGSGLVNFENSLISQNIPFPEDLKRRNLIDEYISGEAEQALPMYFRQGHGPGIGNQNFVQIDNLDDQVWPNYSYYNLQDYKNNQLGVIGSRGCVRKCTFCDVAKVSPKYRYRSGANIANEIIHHYETHGVTNFYFNDSLVNGSLKAFNDLCNTLSKYKFDTPISWSGQYIIRPKNSTPLEHFSLLKESGCKTVFAGIESGCDRVRFELGKKFTNDDIEYYLENFSKFGIEVLFLFFTGYISETEEDHAETLRMFKRWQKYVATGTIQGIETANTLMILPGTPLEQIARQEDFLFLHDGNGVNLTHWINPKIPNFDFKVRVKRHVEMIEEAMKYKWPLWNGEASMSKYVDSLQRYINTPKKFIPISML